MADPGGGVEFRVLEPPIVWTIKAFEWGQIDGTPLYLWLGSTPLKMSESASVLSMPIGTLDKEKSPLLFSVVCISFHYSFNSFSIVCLDVVFGLSSLFSLLVSISGLPWSCRQMFCIEHDQATFTSFVSVKSPCHWCWYSYDGLCWRFLFVKNKFTIFPRHVLWKLERLLISFSVLLQHSDP